MNYGKQLPEIKFIFPAIQFGETIQMVHKIIRHNGGKMHFQSLIIIPNTYIIADGSKQLFYFLTIALTIRINHKWNSGNRFFFTADRLNWPAHTIVIGYVF